MVLIQKKHRNNVGVILGLVAKEVPVTGTQKVIHGTRGARGEKGIQQKKQNYSHITG